MGFDSGPSIFVSQLARGRHHMEIPRKSIVESPRLIQRSGAPYEIMLKS